MSRSQKLQELVIQILVLWFAFSNIANVMNRPEINRGLAALAFVVILSSFILNMLNILQPNRYFKALTLTGSKKLWKFFAISTALILASVMFGWISILYFSPLILLYPIYYFYQHQWLPRAVLLVGLMVVTYSQMRLTKNDRLHAVVQWMTKKPDYYNSSIIKAFDRKTMTAAQAYDVARLLILHPEESSRDYKTGDEFAKIAFNKNKNLKFSKKVAYLLVCAKIGESKLKRGLASESQVQQENATLPAQEECEPLSTREPQSIPQRKKTKYYF